MKHTRLTLTLVALLVTFISSVNFGQESANKPAGQAAGDATRCGGGRDRRDSGPVGSLRLCLQQARCQGDRGVVDPGRRVH